MSFQGARLLKLTAKWLASKNANGKDLHGIETSTNAAESFEHYHLYKHQSINPETTKDLRYFNYCQPLMCTDKPTVSELIYRPPELPTQYAAASLYAELHSHYVIRHYMAGMQGVSCTAARSRFALKVRK